MGYSKSIDTRNRILQAARELFYEQGYENTKIRDICKKAEMRNQASFYQYFDDKLSIVNGITEEFISSLMDFDRKYITERNPLVRFMIVQQINLSKIIIDEKNSRYFSEFEKYTKFDFYDKNNDQGYKQLFYVITKNIHPGIEQENIDFLVNSYATTLGKTIININAGIFKMSRETAVKKMIYFYPQLAGYSDEELDDAYKKALNEFFKLPKEAIEALTLLI